MVATRHFERLARRAVASEPRRERAALPLELGRLDLAPRHDRRARSGASGASRSSVGRRGRVEPERVVDRRADERRDVEDARHRHDAAHGHRRAIGARGGEVSAGRTAGDDDVGGIEPERVGVGVQPGERGPALGHDVGQARRRRQRVAHDRVREPGRMPRRREERRLARRQLLPVAAVDVDEQPGAGRAGRRREEVERGPRRRRRSAGRACPAGLPARRALSST